jgi:hypothetical protein
MSAGFKVSNDWLYYAHGPGADGGQGLACELIDLISGNGGSTVIPADRADLVAEVVDVAGLYTGDSNVQDDDRLWFRAYPGNVIKRGKRWLAAVKAA